MKLSDSIDSNTSGGFGRPKMLVRTLFPGMQFPYQTALTVFSGGNVTITLSDALNGQGVLSYFRLADLPNW
jgi:hypothetical protein